MGIRDKEIDRIVQYAKGLGIKISWKRYERGGPGATWSIDGSEITMYTWPRKSKLEIILDFVHEFAHHMAWIANDKKTPLKYDRALDADAAGIATKEHNRLLYKMECEDARYQDRIFRELRLTIPYYKMVAHKKLALWIYKRIWIDGKKPTEKNMRRKKGEMYAKYKAKYST